MSDISKVLINGTTYNIKDSDSRTKLTTLIGSHVLEALGAAAWAGTETTISGKEGVLPTSQAVKSYVDSAIAVGLVLVSVDSLPVASKDTMGKLYLIPNGQTKSTNVKDEYITIRNGEEGSYTYTWEKIGSTEVDLSNYVQKSRTIAGIDLEDNITSKELQTALGLDDLAYVGTASGTVPAQTIAGVKATGNISGNVTINALTQTSTEASITSKEDYTPAGNVSGTVSVPESANLSKVASGEEGYAITGSVSKPDITLTSDSKEVITGVASAGTVASWSGAEYTAPSLGNASSASFAQKILKPSVDDQTETLSFGWVTDDTGAGATGVFANAVTAQGSFNAGNVKFGTFNGGSMPTFNTGSINNVTGASLANNPVFTGDQVKITFSNSDANINATFAGTTSKELIPSVIKYDKAGANGASFSGNDVELTVGDITVKEQKVTVTPDVE